MPEEVTEKEVTVDAAGKVTEESEPVAVPFMPEHEETPTVAGKTDSVEEVAPIAVNETVEKPSRPITTEDFSHLDFAADMSTTSGKRKVFARNMAAIRTVKRLEDETKNGRPRRKNSRS